MLEFVTVGHYYYVLCQRLSSDNLTIQYAFPIRPDIMHSAVGDSVVSVVLMTLCDSWIHNYSIQFT